MRLVEDAARALGHALEVGPGPRWRRAAENWPESRMVEGLEALYTEWCND